MKIVFILFLILVLTVAHSNCFDVSKCVDCFLGYKDNKNSLEECYPSCGIDLLNHFVQDWKTELKQSSRIQSLKSIANKTLGYVKENPGKAAAAGIFAAPFAFHLSLGLAGFTAAGVTKGSLAAAFMSTYGPCIAKGSLISSLQSLGATGLGYSTYFAASVPSVGVLWNTYLTTTENNASSDQGSNIPTAQRDSTTKE
jgi:hypothetical protein